MNDTRLLSEGYGFNRIGLYSLWNRQWRAEAAACFLSHTSRSVGAAVLPPW